jgi:dipeptidyl aminopeptidase/acylaminoacyl peptidase
VDDALTLLNVALEIEERADPGRIAAIGFSRGATVALLMAIRDPRIDGVVEFFGATDFFGTFVQEIVRDALRGDVRELPGVSVMNEQFIQPAKRKEKDVQALRMELVRRSPVLFAAQLPALQVHHGLIDPVVPPSEAESLVKVMQAMSTHDFEYYFYPNGSHHPLTMEGSIERAADFLLRVANTPPV